jgi:hypothetical protein
MSDTDRVRAWRDRLKQEGRVPMTIWGTAETKARYEDLALLSHRSPSALVQQALDAYRSDHGTVSDAVPDTQRLHTLIREGIAQLTNVVTATVTDTMTTTLLTQLPDLVRAAMPLPVSASATDMETVTEHETAVSVPVTATATATQPKPARCTPVTDAVPDTATETPARHQRRRPRGPLRRQVATTTVADTGEAQPPPPRGRPPGVWSTRILALLAEYPESLTAVEIQAFLRTEKLADTLAGMKRHGKLKIRKEGTKTKYLRA